MTMSRRGVYEVDLNNAPAMWGSVRDGLRRTMIQHEIIFKNQVQELHRLYWMQKDLMSELRRKPSAYVSAAKSRCGSAEVNEVGGVPMPQGISPEFSVGRHKYFDLEVPVMDCGSEPAQEVTDELFEVKGPASDATDVRRAGGNCNSREIDRGLRCMNGRLIIDLEAPAEMDPAEEANAICFSGLKSLRDGGVNVNGSRINGFSSFTLASGLQNDSIHQLSEEHCHADHQRDNWLKKTSVHTNFGISITRSSQSVNPNTQKCQPTSKYLEGAVQENALRKTTKYLHIDLNIAQDGPPADVCPETLQKTPSPSASSSVINGDQWRKSSCIYSSNAEPSSKYQTQPNSIVPDLELNDSGRWMRSVLKHGCNFIRQNSELSSVIETAQLCEKSSLNTEVDISGTGSPVGFCRNSMEGISSMSNGRTQNSTNGSSISSIELNKHRDEKVVAILGQQQISMHMISRSETSNVASSNDIEENCLHPSTEITNLILHTNGMSGRKQTPHEKKEDTVSSRVASSYKQQGDRDENSSDCNKLDRISGSTEFTSKNSSTEELGTTVVRHSCELEVEALRPKRLCCNGASVPEISGVCLGDRSFDICASNPEKGDHPQTRLPEIDLMIFKAAETLVSLSLENSACPFNFNCEDQVQFGSDEAKSQPQISLDSFEEMTLKLEEVNDDGTSAISKQLEKVLGKESCGIKLRKGKGLRDFQKDILPGLVSLSRHEICEDIHTIKHELRKMSSLSTGRESFLSPVRTRRSRIYNACRRI